MKKYFLLGLIICSCLTLFSQNKEQAFEINKRLGRGVNIGNTFEAPSETEWGNPWNPEYVDMIAELGFNHMRLPIRWETRSMATAPYTIDSDFLKRIQSVVDKAIENNLYIIVNMHHHEALIANPSGQKERFLAMWKQIAEYFKDYPENLLFEILNEPNDKMTPELWNQFATDGVKEIRKSNPDRIILIGTAEWGGIGGLSKLQLPEDDNLIVTIHYYNPFNFTHQGADWSGMQDVKDVKWNDTEAERETIHTEFQTVKEFAQKNNVPIHIGEFGAYSKADIDSRVRWTTYLARWFEEQGYSWAYWEFSAGFGIYNPSTKQFIQPLVNALLKNQMPEPAQVVYTSVYESNFSNGTDGWNLYPSSPAKATLSNKNNSLEINITNKGNNSWDIQPTKTGIPLIKGEMYELSFTASASADCSFTSYIGKNSDPWNGYSDYNQTTVNKNTQTYSYSFTMSQSSDQGARIAFDMGAIPSPVTITLKDIKVRKAQIIPTHITDNNISRDEIPFYISANKELVIHNEYAYSEANIYTMNGLLLSNHPITSGINTLNISNQNPGIYLLYLKEEYKNTSFKFIVP